MLPYIKLSSVTKIQSRDTKPDLDAQNSWQRWKLSWSQKAPLTQTSRKKKLQAEWTKMLRSKTAAEGRNCRQESLITTQNGEETGNTWWHLKTGTHYRRLTYCIGKKHKQAGKVSPSWEFYDTNRLKRSPLFIAAILSSLISLRIWWIYGLASPPLQQNIACNHKYSKLLHVISLGSKIFINKVSKYGQGHQHISMLHFF